MSDDDTTTKPPASVAAGRTTAPSPLYDVPPVAPTLPGYAVTGELGRGGMGVVYAARDLALGRTVAVKMVLAGGHASPTVLARFLAEAETVARHAHPHVVQVHHFGRHDGLPFLVMEYVAGGTLADRFAAGPLPPAEAVGLLRPVAEAVAHFHARGLIHRDLKPANVLMAPDGTPKVTDFGLCKQAGDVGLTVTGAILGTPAYMAPELARGDGKAAGPAADVWALGVMLYEGLTGRRPFAGADSWDTLDRVRTTDPTPPRQFVKTVPVDLESVCLKCLEKGTAHRYATAGSLADDLRRFQAGEPVTARPPSWTGRAWRRTRRTARLWPAALACGALAVAGWREWGRQPTPVAAITPPTPAEATPDEADVSSAVLQGAMQGKVVLSPKQLARLGRMVAEQEAARATERQAEANRVQSDLAANRLAEAIRPESDVRGRLERTAARDGPDSPAGLVLRAIGTGRRPGSAADLKAAQTDALAKLEVAISRGQKNPSQFRDELALAYQSAGNHAIALASSPPVPPARQHALIGAAADWGAKLAALEPDRADGPLLVGCAQEDQARLLREPLTLAARCGAEGPYAAADLSFVEALRRTAGDKATAQLSRGRNLFKWAEDQCQLGHWRGTDEPKAAPDDARLAQSEFVLTDAEKWPDPAVKAEARYWLASVAALRYELVERGLRAGDRRHAATTAQATYDRLVALPGEAAAPWRRLAAGKLVWLHLTEGQRLEADGSSAAAIGSFTAAVTVANAAKLSNQEVAQASGLLGRHYLAAGERDESKMAEYWPKARQLLTVAVKLDPQAADQWLWRFSLGRAEVQAGREAKAAAAARAAHFVIAFDHLQTALYKGYQSSRVDPQLVTSYRETRGQIAKLFDEIESSLAIDEALPLTGSRAAYGLTKIALQVDFAGNRVSAEQRQRVIELSAAVSKFRAEMDNELANAAEEIAGRIRSLK